MAELAIIIGNGFDLDLGLPSKYTDFIGSKEWKDVEHSISMFPTDDYRNHSLIYHLQRAAYSKENWFDIEEEIYRFVQEHPECSDMEIRDIKAEFNRLKKALRSYLVRVSDGFKMDESRLPCQFFSQLVNCPKKMVEIYFNYTTPKAFLPKELHFAPGHCSTTYVHGNLEEDNIVLGCDIQRDDQVNRSLSFMYKYNMLNRANHVARDLLEAKEIIFYGHSVNEMDFGYFREFFKLASASPNPKRHLTFITLDETAERAIKDNIRNQGISVTDLYNNLETFTFIHTKKLNDKNGNELMEWNNMFTRLLKKEKRGVTVR